MKIKVTQRHIDEGRPYAAAACALALAVQEAVPMATALTVGTGSGGFSFEGRYNRFALPSEAQNFLSTFEQDKTKAKPFSFEIEPKEERY